MKISKNDTTVYLIYGIILMVLSLLRRFVICGYLSAIVFIMYMVYYAIRNKQIIVKYMFLFFGLAFYSVGNMVCDFIPTYLVELGVVTHYVGSFSLLALFYWVNTLLILGCDTFISERIIYTRNRINYRLSGYSVSKFIYKYSLAIIFALGTLYFVFIAPYPSFAMNINRFTYSQRYLSGFLNKIRTIPVLLSPLALIAVMKRDYLSAKKKIALLVVTYIPYILFCFWIGNKFGAYWQLFWALAIPCADMIDLKRLRTSKYLKIAIRIIVLLLVFVVGYWILRGNDFEAIITKFTVRFAAQGELWWRLVADNSFGSIHMGTFFDELDAIVKSIITSGAEKEYGVYRLMKMFGSSYLESYYDIDMRLSANGFELAFYFMGYAAYFIFPLVSAFCYAILVNLYIVASNEKRISSIVYLRILIVFQTALAQGDWYRFFSGLDIMMLMILLLDTAMIKQARGTGIGKRISQ